MVITGSTCEQRLALGAPASVFTRNEEPEPVEREIPRGAGVLRATLEAQLRGPTPAEQEAGLFLTAPAQRDPNNAQPTHQAGGMPVHPYLLNAKRRASIRLPGTR